MNKRDTKKPFFPSKEREYLLQALRLSEEMMEFSKRGTRFASDNGCLILYGVIRDCAFKIKKIVEEQLDHYREKKENKEE